MKRPDLKRIYLEINKLERYTGKNNHTFFFQFFSCRINFKKKNNKKKTEKVKVSLMTYLPQFLAVLSSPFFCHPQMHFHSCILIQLKDLGPVFKPLPLSDISYVQTVRLRGTRRGECLQYVYMCVRACTYVCALMHVLPVYVQMCVACHFHSLVNRKLNGTNVCQSSDNNRPSRPPFDTVLITDLRTVSRWSQFRKSPHKTDPRF